MRRVPILLTIFLLTSAGSRPTTAPQSATSAPPRTITITVGDPVDGKMSFSLSQIAAKPGERLRVNLVSLATMPKLVMGHNWVLLKLGVDPKAFSDDAMSARDTDFIPPARKMQIVAASALVGPGEKDQVTFTVPKVAGEYPYVCSFAGHFAAGMSGKLLVK